MESNPERKIINIKELFLRDNLSDDEIKKKFATCFKNVFLEKFFDDTISSFVDSLNAVLSNKSFVEKIRNDTYSIAEKDIFCEKCEKDDTSESYEVLYRQALFVVAFSDGAYSKILRPFLRKKVSEGISNVNKESVEDVFSKPLKELIYKVIQSSGCRIFGEIDEAECGKLMEEVHGLGEQNGEEVSVICEKARKMFKLYFRLVVHHKFICKANDFSNNALRALFKKENAEFVYLLIQIKDRKSVPKLIAEYENDEMFRVNPGEYEKIVYFYTWRYSDFFEELRNRNIVRQKTYVCENGNKRADVSLDLKSLIAAFPMVEIVEELDDICGVFGDKSKPKQKKIEELAKRIKELEKENRKTKKALNTEESRNKCFSKTIEELKGKVEENNKKSEEVKNKLINEKENLEFENIRLRGKVFDLQKAVCDSDKNMKEVIEQMKLQNKSLKNRVGEISSEKNELITRVYDVENKLEETKKGEQKYKDKVKSKIEGFRTEALKYKKEKEQEIEKLNKVIKKLKSENQKLNEDKKNLSDENAKLRFKNNVTLKENEKLRGDLVAAKSEIEELKRDNSNLEEKKCLGSLLVEPEGDFYSGSGNSSNFNNVYQGFDSTLGFNYNFHGTK